MFLDYLALAMLCMSLIAVFYLFIFIHDLPHKIAKERHHPHEESIHVACWLSLITLHAMWPIVYAWSVSHKKGAPVPAATSPDLAQKIEALEARLQQVESK